MAVKRQHTTDRAFPPFGVIEGKARPSAPRAVPNVPAQPAAATVLARAAPRSRHEAPTLPGLPSLDTLRPPPAATETRASPRLPGARVPVAQTVLGRVLEPERRTTSGNHELAKMNDPDDPLQPGEVLAFGAEVQARMGISARGDGEFFRRKLGLVSRALSMPAAEVTTRLSQSDPLVWRTIAELVPNAETWLFRDVLELETVAATVARLAATRPVRLLSMGCSTGEEVHALASLLLARMPGAARSVSLVGVDVSATRIARAQTGKVSVTAMKRVEAPLAEWPAKYARVEGDAYRFREPIRTLETFAVANLADAASLLGLGAFDVVMCRHVLGAFAPTAAVAAVERLRALVGRRGCLLLGAGEQSMLESLEGGRLRDDGLWWRSH